jgi:hypothetical protein
MHSTVFRVETDVTLLTNDLGDTVGHMVAVPRAFDPTGYQASRVDYAGYAHDWNGESSDYDPLSIGVFDDPDSLKNEVARRAREA